MVVAADAVHDGRVSSLGDSPTPAAATRATRPGWRDTRLWLGVVIVAVSVVAGARLLAAADESVAVWAATEDLAVGHRVTGEDLATRRVRFVSPDDLDRYLPAHETLPADARLVRGVGAGELVPRAAVGRAADTGMLALPISVDPSLLPPGVGPGTVVNVYLTAGGRRCPACDGPALAGVTVTAAPTTADLSGVRQVVVQVTEQDADRWFELLSGLDTPVVTVASRG